MTKVAPKRSRVGDCSDYLATINLSDDELSSFEGLCKVIPSIFVQYASYWLKKTDSDKLAIKNRTVELVFETQEEQLTILRPIVRAMNRATAANDDLLSKLPIKSFVFGDQEATKKFLAATEKDAQLFNGEVYAQREFYQRDGIDIVFLLLTSPPLDRLYYRRAMLVSISPKVAEEYLIRRHNLLQHSLTIEPEESLVLELELQRFKDCIVNKTCGTCKKNGANKRCMECGTCYCDQECQRAAWSHHRLVCKQTRYIKALLMSSGDL